MGHQLLASINRGGGVLLYDYAVTYNMDVYLQYYLDYPILIADKAPSEEEISAMPPFSANGSVRYVGSTVVVRLF